MAQDLSAAFAEYLDRLVVIENRSPRTVDKYRRDGAKMVAFFEQHGKPTVTDVDRAAANAWLADLAKTLHPNTRRCRIAMAQGFFGDIKDLGLIAVNPFAHYPRPKLVRQHRPYCQPHQAQLVFANIATTTFDGARLRLLLKLCYHAGLRLAEALALNWADIDFGLNEISVVGKGNQPGMMPVNDELRAELLAYQARWARSATATSPVFVSRCGNRLLAKHVYPSLKKYGLKGMGQRLWRRSALTNLANASVPLHVVSGYARHASLASLTPYDPGRGANPAADATVVRAHRRRRAAPRRHADVYRDPRPDAGTTHHREGCMITRSNIDTFQLGHTRFLLHDHDTGLPAHVVARGATSFGVRLAMTVAPSSRLGVWHLAWPNGRHAGAQDALIPLGRLAVHFARSSTAKALAKLPIPIQPSDIPSWDRNWREALEEIERFAHDLGYDSVRVFIASQHPRSFLLITGQQFQCPACPRGNCRRLSGL